MPARRRAIVRFSATGVGFSIVRVLLQWLSPRTMRDCSSVCGRRQERTSGTPAAHALSYNVLGLCMHRQPKRPHDQYQHHTLEPGACIYTCLLGTRLTAGTPIAVISSGLMSKP